MHFLKFLGLIPVCARRWASITGVDVETARGGEGERGDGKGGLYRAAAIPLSRRRCSGLMCKE